MRGTAWAAGAAAAAAAAVVLAAGCGTVRYQVAVGPDRASRRGTALQVPAGLSTLLAVLMHVRTGPGTGVMMPACGKLPRGVRSGLGVPAGRPLKPVRNTPCAGLVPPAR